MSASTAESIPGPPLPTGYGPASAAIAATILQQQLLLAAQGVAADVDSGSEGDSSPDSSSHGSAAATVHESDPAGPPLGLDGTNEGASGSGGQDGDGEEYGPGQGNWGHGKGAPWTTAQDLELLRIYEQYPDWTPAQVAVEFNNRFQNERPRTGQAVRQRRANLRKKGETVTSILSKMPGGGKGGGSGSGGAAGGAAGAITA